jgi:hypothetical protein
METDFGGTAYWLSHAWAGRLSSTAPYIAAAGALVLAVFGAFGVWGSASVAEFSRRATDPSQVETRGYVVDGKMVVEMHPRGGRWYPFVVLVPIGEKDKIVAISYGPSGSPPDVSIVLGMKPVEAEGKYAGLQIENPVDRQNSAYVTLSGQPSELVFGQRGGELARVTPGPLPAR